MSKKKTVTVGSFMCLLPIVMGSILWNFMPNKLFSQIGREPYISKEVIVFVLPFLFLLLHFIVVFKPDWLNTPRDEKKYWYIPVLSNIFFLISFIWSFVES